MKKIFAIILSVAMLATMSVTAFAVEGNGTINTVDGSQQIDITAKYNAGLELTTVYKVDVEWGSMEFTYTEPSAGVWNPETHQYDGRVYQGFWSHEADSNKITVTNHSNAAVTVNFAVQLPSGIYGNFTNVDNETITSLSLDSAVYTAVDEAPTAVAYFNVTNGMINIPGKLGTITITIE